MPWAHSESTLRRQIRSMRLMEDRDTDAIAALRELEKKVLWLASWTIHNANHLREND